MDNFVRGIWGRLDLKNWSTFLLIVSGVQGIKVFLKWSDQYELYRDKNDCHYVFLQNGIKLEIYLEKKPSKKKSRKKLLNC